MTEITNDYLLDPKPRFLRGFQKSQELISFLKEREAQPGLAIVGRSNVGKSSLINALFSKKTAKVSNTPGRTREINVFEFQLINKDTQEPLGPFLLFDLPGYGHASVSKEMKKNWEDLMVSFFKSLPDGILLYNIQDARHPATKVDYQFLQFIDPFVGRKVLIFNKYDKLKTQKERSAFKKKQKEVMVDFKTVQQIFTVSAEKKTGLDTLTLSLTSHLLEHLENSP